jgi:hypothetical protein
MNARNDVPGYGFQLKKGATSLTESWAALEKVSNNHWMLGHLMEWFYAGVGGIRQVANGVAFNQLEINPSPVDGIPSATTNFNTSYGKVSTDWVKTVKGFKIKISIPVNTAANVYLPASSSSATILEGGKAIATIDGIKPIGYNDGKYQLQVGSGDYYFEVRE